MTSMLDNYRPTVGLSMTDEVPCRSCGGTGVDYSVPPRAVQIANLDRRTRTRRGRGARFCWYIGVTVGNTHRPLARVEAQWGAHGHDLLGDHPLLALCGTCYGNGVLVAR